MLYSPRVIGTAFRVTETQVTPSVLEWVQAAPADPDRVWLAFGGVGVGSYQLTTNPDPGLANGFEIPAIGLWEIEFTKCGPLAGLEWFVWGKGVLAPLTVFSASIPNPRPGLEMEF